jgi:hypothetical protein
MVVVYILLFWLDYAQEIEYQTASRSRDKIVDAAVSYLRRLRVPEASYEEFLTDGIRGWDGQAVHITTVAAGKLILMAAPLDHHLAEQPLDALVPSAGAGSRPPSQPTVD